MFGVLAVVVIIGEFVVVNLAARRYEARQRKLGRWDEYGPLVETNGPPPAIRSGGMSERLEIVGRWKGKILQRREPHEKP